MLCEHNPHRRCNVNFAPKYLVNDVLKAKCEAPIRVEIIDRATGVPLGEDIPDVQLEVSHRMFQILTCTAMHTRAYCGALISHNTSALFLSFMSTQRESFT